MPLKKKPAHDTATTNLHPGHNLVDQVLVVAIATRQRDAKEDWGVYVMIGGLSSHGIGSQIDAIRLNVVDERPIPDPGENPSKSVVYHVIEMNFDHARKAKVEWGCMRWIDFECSVIRSPKWRDAVFGWANDRK
jgi:hypothetical protein